MSAPRSGTRCSFTTDIGGGSVQCDAYQGHPGPHTAMVPGRVVVVDTTTSDGKIADLARAYGKAYGVEASVEDIAVEPDPDTEAGRVIDARAPWVRRLTAVVVRGTEPTDPPTLRMYAGGGV